ncbi:MAG TPA: adenylate cyclase regulatory domain-containing protein [Acidimicrobiales bacterium]|nr:adenylate cyclase regulatory domain-containing protein [Acidimicrobiales bacterium]
MPGPAAPPGPAELAAAGLYDPDAPDAADRLELLQFLAGEGVTLADMAGAGEPEALVALAAQRPLGGGQALLTIEEVAAAAHTSPDRVMRLRMASGLPAVPGEPMVPPSTVDDMAAFDAGAALFGEVPTLSFSRVMGSAMARVAEAAVSLFLIERRPQLVDGVSDAARARDTGQATAVFIGLAPAVMNNLLREHMARAIRRSVAERADEFGAGAVTVGLGFVDLVGSTAWASGLSLTEHALALTGFESAAWDIAAAHHGRVVKLMGDEAMFIAPSAVDAARIARELCRAVAADPALPEARGAVGHGVVAARDGDYFGPLVNLVAHAVEVAEPSTVVVTEVVRDALERNRGAGEEPWDVSALSGVGLRGVDDAVRLFAVR